jgi:hypothetical protein
VMGRAMVLINVPMRDRDVMARSRPAGTAPGAREMWS